MRRVSRKIRESHDEELYDLALNELRSGRFSKPLWSKALAKCSFNEDKARGAYVDLRVEQLKDLDEIERESDEVRAQTEEVDCEIVGLKTKLLEAKIEAAFSNPLFLGQLIVVSGMIGLYQNSWVLFFASFFALAVLMIIPYINSLLGVVLAVIFGLSGYTLSVEWWSQTAGYWVGAVVFLLVLGLNLDAIKVLK